MRDLKGSDLVAHLKLLGATYEEAFPGSGLEVTEPRDLTNEINRLCDELAVDLLEQMPVEQVPKTARVRVLRTATEKLRAAAAELLRIRQSGRA